MSQLGLYYFLVILCAAQRIAELRHSRINEGKLRRLNYAAAESRGALTQMILLHLFWFVGLCVEPVLFAWEIIEPLAILCLGVFLAAQFLRYWAIISLGQGWSVQALAPQEDSEFTPIQVGPYRYIRHPNYLAVIIEIACLPLVGGAYGTAILFSLLNSLLLRRRILAEERALSKTAAYRDFMARVPRFIPFHLFVIFGVN